MTGRVDWHHVRVLPRPEWARPTADRFRQLAAARPDLTITWHMSPDMARHLADLLERGADAIEGIEAQLQAMDVELDRVRKATAAAQARDALAAEKRARREVWYYGVLLAVTAHVALWQVVLVLLRAVGADV